MMRSHGLNYPMCDVVFWDRPVKEPLFLEKMAKKARNRDVIAKKMIVIIKWQSNRAT